MADPYDRPGHEQEEKPYHEDNEAIDRDIQEGYQGPGGRQLRKAQREEQRMRADLARERGELADLEQHAADGTTPWSPEEEEGFQSAGDEAGGDYSQREDDTTDENGNTWKRRFGNQHKRENIKDQLNKGYTGNGDKKTATSKRFHGNDRLQKKVAIAGAIAGGSIVGTFLVFMMMLPLKLTHIMANIEAKYMASTTEAVGKQTENFISRYIGTRVMPSLLASPCHTTADPSCRRTPTGCAGPVCALYNAWSQGNLEYKLANQHGIVIARNGTGPDSFYISVDKKRIGNPEQMLQLQRGEISFFDLDGLDKVSRTELRKRVMDTTKGYQIFKRHKLGKLLEVKFGVKRCIFFCKVRDKITDSIEARKLAVKSVLIQRTLSGRYGIVLQCVLVGTENCKSDNLLKASKGDTESLTPLQKQFQEYAAKAIEEIGDKTIEELAEDISKQSEEISRYGLKRIIAKQAVSSIVGLVGGDAAGEAAGQIASKYGVPTVGWAVVLLQTVATLGTLGFLLQHAGFATNTGVAVAMYATHASEIAECQSGHCDPAIVGEFGETLATSISGNPDKSVDFTKSKLWQYNYGDSSSANSLLAGLFTGNAYADGPSSEYLCDDGQPVPADKLVCSELNFAESGNAAASAVSESLNAVPGLVPTAEVATKIVNTPFELLSKGLEIIPGASVITGWVGDQAAAPMAMIEDHLLTAPDLDSGARQVDMMMAGADAANNSSCQIQLGCARISDQEVADIQNRQLAEQHTEFENLPLFARVFSTTTPYSLVSRIAIAMPGNTIGLATSSLSSLLANPLQKIGSVFANLLPTRSAFAATPAMPDPFGIPQYGYLNEQIPNDPEKYWAQNCQSHYDDATGQLDISEWLNRQRLDPITGQAEATMTNPCLLIQATVQSVGGMFDTKLLPPGSGTPDQ